MILASIFSFYVFSILVSTSPRIPYWDSVPLTAGKPPISNACDKVCEDLPVDDVEPICMMYSRYKKGYQFFVNLCHARKVICKENLFLNVVHANRCMISNQFFLPIV